MSEQWKITERFPWFEISNYGRLRKIGNGEICKTYFNNRGYECRTIYSPEDKRCFTMTIHSLVAQEFLGPRPDGMTVNHCDTNKRNNRWDNLEYLSHGDNIRHAIKAGVQMRPGKISIDQVRLIRDMHKAGKDQFGWKNSYIYSLLAEEFGISEAAVRNICTGKSWKYVKQVVD